MADGEGPTQAMPASATAWAKASFSDRKPYPGCTASAPVARAMARTASASVYEEPSGSARASSASSAAGLRRSSGV